jgi:urease accessory protein
MHLSDFIAGLAHPVSGADHILAMVAIGLWGVVAGGRAVWAWPVVFLTMVLAGFTAAILGLHVPFVQPAIAASIVVLGLLIALTVEAPLWLGAVIAGLFAFFHGHAHGTEAAASGIGLVAFAIGFSLATAALHIVGIAGGLMLAGSAERSLLRTAGSLIALGGLALIAMPA